MREIFALRLREKSINATGSTALFACILALLLLVGCDSKDVVKSQYFDLNSNGKSDKIIHIQSKLNLLHLVEVDANHDETMDDWTWVRHFLNEPKEKLQILYNEIHKKNIPVEKIWFGPGNVKIIGKQDVNGDGFLETTIYYNRNARPKVTGGTIARGEFDVNKDGQKDLWMYPNARMEVDTTGNGKPDKFTEDIIAMGKYIAGLGKNIDRKLPDLKSLSESKSWALDPRLITRKENVAIIPVAYE